MMHSFRFGDNMERVFQENKKILSNITGIPVEDLNDTQVINFCLSRVNQDYKNFIDKKLVDFETD